jgi:hypothetical protein
MKKKQPKEPSPQEIVNGLMALASTLPKPTEKELREIEALVGIYHEQEIPEEINGDKSEAE